MSEKKEIEAKIRKTVALLREIKDKEAKGLIQTEQEKEKIKRLKIFLTNELKGYKEKLDKIEELNGLSINITADEITEDKAFSKNSMKETKSKYRIYLIPYMIILAIYSIYLLLQPFLYKKAFMDSLEIDYKSSALDNFFFVGIFLVIILIIYFTIFIVNAKLIKRRLLIAIISYIGLIFSFISYLNLETNFKIINNFSSGKGSGSIFAFFLFISIYFLAREFKYTIDKKRIKVRKKDLKKVFKEQEKEELRKKKEEKLKKKATVRKRIIKAEIDPEIVSRKKKVPKTVTKKKMSDNSKTTATKKATKAVDKTPSKKSVSKTSGTITKKSSGKMSSSQKETPIKKVVPKKTVKKTVVKSAPSASRQMTVKKSPAIKKAVKAVAKTSPSKPQEVQTKISTQPKKKR